MLSKNTIKHIQSLHQKKFRQKYRNFVVEGEKMALEILLSQSIDIVSIYALEDWTVQYRDLLQVYAAQLTTITAKDLGRISGLKTPNKVLCICKIPNYSIDSELVNKSLSLYLDGIQDPGNMGSILRIADWFGIPYVFCSLGCVEIYNAKVIQASMGAFLRVQTLEKDLSELKAEFPNLVIFASVLDGENVFSVKEAKAGLLVIGNEGKGVSTETRVLADHQVTIPKGNTGGAESLNAAVATGILCSALIK